MFSKFKDDWSPDDAPNAIVVDLDNTLALLNGRSPYRGDLCEGDSPDPAVLWLIRSTLLLDPRMSEVAVIFLTGRNESARTATQLWLRSIGVFAWEALIMRAEDDWRPSDVYKLDKLQNEIIPAYNVLFMLDDDDRVVRVVRELGIACWQSRDRLNDEGDHDGKNG